MAARASRWWRFPLYGLGALLALVLILSLLLQTGLAREQIRQRVNAALEPLFQGKIQIERLDHVGLWGVAGVDARIFDPDGRQVIRAQGLEAHADLPRLGWQLLFGGASPRLTIDRVRIDYADVTLREHEELGVTLASTFELADAEEPPGAEDSQGTVELSIPVIELERVWAHGRVTGSPALDADLLELRGELRQGQAGFALELERADVVTRALPGGSEPRGRVWGSIDVPSEQERPLRLEGFLDGRAAGSPLWLETTWVGDDLYAKLSLPRIPADYINGQVSGLALQGELALLAEAHGTLPELDLFADVRGSAGHVAVTGNAFLADGLEALLLVSASNVNLAGIAADAPASNLSAQLQALVFEEQEEELELAHRLDVAKGHLDGVATPPLGVTGRLTLPTTGGLAAWGGWQLAEPGASLGGRYRASLAQERDDFVSISLAGQLSDPPRAALLGVQAAGEVHGEAELWLESELIKAKLDMSLSRLDYQTGSAPPLQARAVELRAQLTGSIDDPRAHAAATVELLSGRAHVDVHYGAHEQEASLFLADIDLHRVAALLGTPLPFEQGNLNADLSVRRQGPSSRPYELNGKLRADLGTAGTVELTATSLKLPSKLEGPLPLASLSGELTANGKLDLARTPRLASMLGFPLERSTGIVRFELTGKRADGSAPELALLLDTNGLRIIQRREPRDQITTTSQAIENKPFALEGIDAHASLRFLPATGELVGTVITRDRGGTLALLEAEAKLGKDWPVRLSEPRGLMQTPLRARIEVPERRMQSLPPLLRPPGLRGRAALEAEFDGSLAEPRVRGWLLLRRLRTQRGGESVDLRTNVRYSRADGELYARASGSRGQDLGLASARWQGDALRAATQPPGEANLVASAEAELFGLPLEVLPVLAEQQLKGRITGLAKLRDWGKNAEFDARLEGQNLQVGTTGLPGVLLSASHRGDKLLAELGVKTTQGTANVKLEADASWGSRAVPVLKQRGMARLSTKRFELASLSPLLGAYVSELSGMLDADAQVAVDAAGTRVAGTARLENGVVQVPAIGQRFSQITAKVAVGDNQFKLQELSARGLTGRLTATGAAQLNGFALRSAELRASVHKKEPLPVTIEGAALGDAWGNVHVSYRSPETGERLLDINVPEFRLTTPDSGGTSLQDLDNAESIRIGTRRSDGTFVTLPIQPLEPDDSDSAQGEASAPAQPLRIRIQLGNNVTVARGTTAQAQLSGRLEVLTSPETSVTGRLEIRGGKLDVQGKTFEIERGVITFYGKDPANPTITATARWDAPEHTVYADYVGDVETGRIKLRSEPPLSQDQLASLLLFGDPDGSRGGSDPNTAALAVSVAGETAAKGLNKALADFTSLDVRARVDTTTGSARPELALQVSPRVAAKVTRAIGEPAVGESPDRTFLTLELRLRRGWALSALLGDHGASALDLIWRHRY